MATPVIVRISIDVHQADGEAYLDLWFENPFEVTQEQAESIGTKLMLLDGEDIVFDLKLNTHSCNFCEL